MAGEDLLVAGGGLLALFAGMMFLFFIIIIGLYIYVSLAFMAIAKKAKLATPGLAWIPGVGPAIIAYQASKMHWWPWLLLIGVLFFMVPVIGIVIYFLAIITFIVYYIIWLWKMYEVVGKPGWWAILMIIPVVGWVMIGIAAWSKDEAKAQTV